MSQTFAIPELRLVAGVKRESDEVRRTEEWLMWRKRMLIQGCIEDGDQMCQTHVLRVQMCRCVDVYMYAYQFDDIICNGMAWHGMAWHGMAWHGMAWHGMAQHSTAQHSIA